MKEEQQIPPGIVAFEKKGRMYYVKPDYNKWVDYHLRGVPSTIHTLSVDGKEYSVGDEVETTGKSKTKIIAFQWNETIREWTIEIPYNDSSRFLPLFVVYKSALPPQQDRSVSQPGREELIRQNKIANESMGLTDEILNSEEWANLKWEIGQILTDNITLSDGGKFIELNPATHMLAALFYHQSYSQPSQPGEGKEQDYSDTTIDDAVIRAYTRQIYKLKCEIDSLNRELKSRPTEGWSDTQLKDFAEYCDNHEGSMENLFKQWKNKPST